MITPAGQGAWCAAARARVAVLAMAAGGCGGAVGGPTQPPGPAPSPGPAPVSGLACGGEGGTVRTAAVTLPERGTGRPLAAQAWAPDAGRQTAPCPVLSLLPGGGAQIASVAWAAERLAASGYVVVVTLPANGVSTEAYHLAAVSGIDFLQSAASPYRASADTGRVGVAGWSLGARSLTRTQAEDVRVDALVAWDNLAVSETGDAGSPACQNVPGPVRAPRVPALGQASETCAGLPADAKLTAFERWRQAGVPAMQVVFAGATHFWWSAQAGGAQHDLAHAYTRAWFDRWLKADTTATARLLGSVAPGLPSRATADVVSARFRSAAAFDGRACPDLRAGC
jgi:dienelactone hydrolase